MAKTLPPAPPPPRPNDPPLPDGPPQALSHPLSHHQLSMVIAAADKLPHEKRTLFLQRINARLQLYGGRLTDAELNAAVALALTGLIQQPQPTA